MKKFVLMLLIITTVFVSGCTGDGYQEVDEDVYDELVAIFSLYADDAEAEADFAISDLSVDSADEAFANLRIYATGRSVSRIKVNDSIKYLERYINALENEFKYLDQLLK